MFKRQKALFAFLVYFFVVGLIIYGFREVTATIENYSGDLGVSSAQREYLLAKAGEFEGKRALQKISQWPLILPLFQFVAILLLSELILLASCDMISRDRSRGSLRFLFLRTTRGVYYVAKFLSHFVVYLFIHTLSLVALGLAAYYTTSSYSFERYFVPVFWYSLSIAPFILFALALTIFASSRSKSIISALFKAHLLWFPVIVIMILELIPYFSWRSFVGIVSPFDIFGVSNLIGYGVGGCVITYLGFLLFKRAEV